MKGAVVSCNNIIFIRRIVDRVLYYQVPAVFHAAGCAGSDYLYPLIYQHLMGSLYSDLLHAAVS